MLIDSDKGRHPVHADRLQASLPCAISPICIGWKRSLPPPTNSTPSGRAIAHGAVGQRHGQPSDQQSCGSTNAYHFCSCCWCFLDVPSPIPVHTHRAVAIKCCAGVTPDSCSGVHRCYLVQPINCRFRPSGVHPSAYSDRSFSATLARK